MDAYKIIGGKPLRGSVRIKGSKNAALPCLYATLLTSNTVTIRRVPQLRDTRTACELLEHLGKKVDWDKDSVVIQDRLHNLKHHAAGDIPYDLVRKMRASVLSAGPMLARWGKTHVALPGGCSIGLRPIDIHLKGLRAMGAKIESIRGDLEMTAPARGLKPVRFRLPFASVGATQNLMMAASLIPGKTVLANVAREPEIWDLARLLNDMGAKVYGAGTPTVTLYGQKKLQGALHYNIADRLEAGSFAVFAACVGGSDLKLMDCEPKHLGSFLDKLKKTGVGIEAGPDYLRIRTKKNFRPRPVSIKTLPYPGFPTDLQPQWMALMAKAKGKSTLQETIFEKRFIHAAEMNRMGADIHTDGDKAIVVGRDSFLGAKIMASDIRAGAGLVACALAAKGETIISRIYHIERGYMDLEQRLTQVGARIKRFTEIKFKKV